MRDAHRGAIPTALPGGVWRPADKPDSLLSSLFPNAARSGPERESAPPARETVSASVAPRLQGPAASERNFFEKLLGD